MPTNNPLKMDARQKILKQEMDQLLLKFLMLDITSEELSTIITELDNYRTALVKTEEKNHEQDEDDKAFSLSTSII
jgi:hypothetical protein